MLLVRFKCTSACYASAAGGTVTLRSWRLNYIEDCVNCIIPLVVNVSGSSIRASTLADQMQLLWTKADQVFRSHRSLVAAGWPSDHLGPRHASKSSLRSTLGACILHAPAMRKLGPTWAHIAGSANIADDQSDLGRYGVRSCR